MSILNTGKNKGKKKNNQQPTKPGFPGAKGKANTKGSGRNTRFTGGAQRGS